MAKSTRLLMKPISADISYYFNGRLYVKLLKNRREHKKAPVGTYPRPAQVPQ
jgi:hypothetical protein